MTIVTFLPDTVKVGKGSVLFPPENKKNAHSNPYIYSRTLMAQTLMARLPWLFQTLS